MSNQCQLSALHRVQRSVLTPYLYFLQKHSAASLSSASRHSKGTTKNLFVRVSLSLVLLVTALSASASDTIDVLVTHHVENNYSKFLANRSPIEIKHYSGDGITREILELILLHQALRQGGYQGVIDLNSREWIYDKQIKALQAGHATLIGTTLWKEDFTKLDTHIIASPALIRTGEFEAGLYTTPDNKTAITARSLQQVRKLSAISNPNWPVDWRALNQIKLKHLFHASDWDQTIRAVMSRRADFMLAPLMNYTQGIEGSSMDLTVIPEVKILLNSSRHWAFSRQASNSEKVMKNLEQGLAIMRSNGSIARALRESRFINPATEHWLVLNPQPQD